MAVKQHALLYALQTNFPGLEKIIMKRNVACSSKALQVLSLQLDWMCATEKALAVPFISAVHQFLGEESERTSVCLRS